MMNSMRPMKGMILASVISSATFTISAGGTSFKPLPVGKWKVEFANKVVETVEVAKNGEATVSEPLRSARAVPEIAGDSTVIFTFADDRLERWTRVGRRQVVEHWYPVNSYPSAAPVIGIADRLR